MRWTSPCLMKLFSEMRFSARNSSITYLFTRLSSKRYCILPSARILRVTLRFLPLSSNSTVTSATFEPCEIRSPTFLARNCLRRESPKANWRASVMLLFPLPFGPITQSTPGVNVTVAFLNDLKFFRTTLSTNIVFSAFRVDGRNHAKRL
jgi:hypothetical protein